MASVFEAFGFHPTIDHLKAQVCELYLADGIPWVVGYSGGKDSTATLQLVWMALETLPPSQLSKPVHVISTDTLVENPVVAAWVTRSLQAIDVSAQEKGLPIRAHRLTPALTDTFWVNLIGKGYPAPRPKFRWCTERLKIRPSNTFITEMVRESGEAIVILGTRKAESTKRAAVMERLERQRVRERLSPNDSLPNSFVYSPIEDWSNDDVWLFLMQLPNPWGYDNKDLLTMYQGASPDGECPLVVDTSTPSCGDSRFGCWVCTLVDKDKSMQAMIQNDDEKEWMLPLLELRNALDVPDDRLLRDFRRMRGGVQLFHDRPIPGPYLQKTREDWLHRVLSAQTWVRRNGPEYVRDIQLITVEELQEIRRIWVVDKHEVEDSLPRIFEAATGGPYPAPSLDENPVFGADEVELLKSVCGGEGLHFAMTRELLDLERQHLTMVRRQGLLQALDQAIERGFFEDEEDATSRARQRLRPEANRAIPSDNLPFDDVTAVSEVDTQVPTAEP